MRNVEMTQTLGTSTGQFITHQVYRLDDATADAWIRAGIARETERLPAGIDELFRRLDIGAGKACLFLPFVGEFGHQIMSHIRLVHFHKAARKVVCCRPGEEVLYPGADEFVTDWADPIADRDRVGTLRGKTPAWRELIDAHPGLQPLTAGDLSPEQEIYPIHPLQRIPFKPKARGYRADVVLGVRRRDFAPERNWKHWERVAEALTAAGVTFAVIGARSTSFDLPGQVMHSDGDTDAAVELLQNCRLYIGTDTGTSHLAAAVGAPMLVFREAKSQSRNLIGRMRETAPRLAFIDAWYRPELVVEQALAMLAEPAPAAIAEPQAPVYTAQHGEDRWLEQNWKALKLPKRGTFVEVGAADGVKLSNTYWLAWSKGWTGVLVEPDPRQTADLTMNRPESYIVASACVAGGAGTVSFGIEPEPTLSGIKRKSAKRENVPAEPLGTILDRLKVRRVDVLSIDTEGTELDVWAGLDLDRWRPRVVIIEHETEGMPGQRERIIHRLTADGYNLAAELGGNLIFTNKPVKLDAVA